MNQATPTTVQGEPGQPSSCVLLLHGLRSTPDELLTVYSALRRSGAAIVHLQIPGYSYEAVASDAPAHAHWIAFVAEQIALLRQQHTAITLVGLSAGATLALATALRHPGLVDKLVLLSTTLWYDGWNIPFYQFLMPLALYTPVGRLWSYRESPPYGVKNERVRAWIVKELKSRAVSRAGAAVIDIAYLREYDRMRRYVIKALPRARCPPGLLIHAREDEVASLANMRFVQQHWHGGSVETVVLENSYHMITLDNERHRVAQEVVRFVSALDH